MNKVNDPFFCPQVTVYIKKTQEREKSRKELARELSRMGHELFERGLMELYGICGARVRIRKNDFGKPYLLDFPQIHFNISHSGAYAVCVFSPIPIGIDIQKVQPVHCEAIAGRYFTGENRARVLKSDDPIHTFFRIWTEEESYGKWLGSGLPGAFAEEKKKGAATPLPMEKEYYGMIWAECRVRVKIRRITG